MTAYERPGEHGEYFARRTGAPSSFAAHDIEEIIAARQEESPCPDGTDCSPSASSSGTTSPNGSTANRKPARSAARR